MDKILLSTAYLPPVSWMATALQTNQVTIEIHETYPKQTYRNRCSIGTSSGILNLSIPVIKTNGNRTVTKDIKIDHSLAWPETHWRSIETAYNRTPYLLFYRDYFEPLYAKKYNYLLDLNMELLQLLFSIMGVKNKPINLTTEYVFFPEQQDFREFFHPKIKHENYADSRFERYFQPFEPKHGFLPNLSIIDALFCLGPDLKDYLLTQPIPSRE